MKQIIKKLTPAPLRKLDNFLLTNYPLLWSSKLLYLVYFELIIFIITFVIASIRPVSYVQVPSLLLITGSTLLLNIFILIVWTSTQTLLNVITYGGKTTPFLSAKIALLFLAPFIIECETLLISTLRQDLRVNKTLVENILPLSDSILYEKLEPVAIHPTDTTTNTGSSLFKTRTIRYLNRDDLSKIETAFDKLSEQEKRSVLLAAGSIDFRDFSWIAMQDSIRPSLRFILFPKRNIQDTLTVFYKELLANDSFYSSKFSRKVYYRKMPARLFSSNRHMQKDTLLERYYFYNKPQGQIVICDKGSIQNTLIVTYIRETIEQDSLGYREGERESLIKELISNYYTAKIDKRDALSYFFMMAYGGCIIGASILMIFGFIRLFGYKLYLMTIAVIIAFLYLVAYFMSGSINNYIIPSWLIIGYIGFYTIKAKKGHISLIFLQVFSFLICFVLGGLPFYLENVVERIFLHLSPATIDNLKIFNFSVPAIALLLFSMQLFSKMYKTYVNPY